MSGFIRLEGDNFAIGRKLGRYWGNYFSSLNITRRNSDEDNQSYHAGLFFKYKRWLKQQRNELGDLQAKVKDEFPDIWQEILGFHEGLSEAKLGFVIHLGGLFSCMIAEADEMACSTAILHGESGYTMIHSDEYDDTDPLVAADVTLRTGEHEQRFFSISHPFQLLGSAAGMNSAFAVQGNSIGCKEKIRKLTQKNIPKTIFSRKILEETSPQKAAELYAIHPCSLPNHHLFISCSGAYSLQVRLGQSVGECNQVKLERVEMKPGKTFCHTNHFQNDSNPQLWIYEGFEEESPERLDALREMVKGATTPSELETKFQQFLRRHPRQLNRKRLLDQVSGFFSFQVGHSGAPHLRSLTSSYSWKL